MAAAIKLLQIELHLDDGEVMDIAGQGANLLRVPADGKPRQKPLGDALIQVLEKNGALHETGAKVVSINPREVYAPVPGEPDSIAAYVVAYEVVERGWLSALSAKLARLTKPLRS